ncbi:hypothetical protein [Chryseobacterium phocaeense]|uniref:hypothetical protein n=1 Tax=Chryseobacterium phocaeense TaxID=1816690 RepID=UPI0009BA7C42|nr:hypothetical protein [Chryseobacterium phocaeense]
MNNEPILIFQELTLKGYLETQEYIKRVNLNIKIGTDKDKIKEMSKSFRKMLNSDLEKIFLTLQDGTYDETIEGFFSNIDFQEIYDNFLMYYDKEVEGLLY